jgi:hypothetical protein
VLDHDASLWCVGVELKRAQASPSLGHSYAIAVA